MKIYITISQLVVIRAQTMVVIHALHSNRTHMRRFFLLHYNL